jgi:uncharacterized protein (TIGR02246 family)
MSVEQEIKNGATRFEAAFNQRDAAALAADYAEDAVLLPPDSPAERGRQAVESGYQEVIEAGWKNMTLGSIEIGSDGDLAYHIGTYAADVPTKEGTSNRVKGKFLDVYKRQGDGSWKIQATMFNSDEPASQ